MKKRRTSFSETVDSLHSKLTDTLKHDKDPSKMNEYLLENGHILFSYYNQKKTEISSIDTKQQHHSSNGGAKTIQGPSILDFFNKIKDEQEASSGSEKTEMEKPPEDAVVKETEQISRYQYAQKYMQNINQDYIVQEKEDFQITCPDCNVKMYLLVQDGQYVCNKCGVTQSWIVDSERVTYKEPPKEVSYFCYKRINHFNEWLAQFQAKESTDIPKVVYRKVIGELSKDKHTQASQITAERVRTILRRTGFNRYYEHVHHIMNRITGITPPSIDRKTEETLRMMFKQIQVPFNKHCPRRNKPNQRKNFLHYGYVLYKFLQLLEYDDLLKHFTLLKSREKLHEHDELWKKICAELKWEFIPSV